MPIIKSAIKRAKQTKVRTARNVALKRDVRTATKAVETAVASKNGKKAAEALIGAQSALDTAVKKHLIHKNRASRKKAQLVKLVKTVPGSAPTKKAVTKKTTTKKVAPKKTTTKKPTAKKTTTKNTPAKKSAAKK